MRGRFILFLVGLLVVSQLLAACIGREKLRVATTGSWPPFESMDEASQQVVGFDIDLVNAVAEKAGFEVEYVSLPWDSLLAGIANCQYDLAVSAITITEKRSEKFSFSAPYFSAGQIVAVRTDNMGITGKESLTGKTVAVQLGTTGDLEAKNLPDVTVKIYDETDQIFQVLLEGKVDAIIADRPLVVYYMGKDPGQFKMVGEVFTDEQYGIAICKTKPDLVKKINKALEKLKAEGVIDQLTQKWIAGGK